MFGTVGLRGPGSVLACLGLSHVLDASRAASVAKGLNVLFTCRAGLGNGALWEGFRLRRHDTVAVAWGLAEAQTAGDSRAVTSAGPETTGHELGTDITAVGVSHSAPGWAPRGAGVAMAGWGGHVITAAEHPLSTG